MGLTNGAALPGCLALFFHGIGKYSQRGKNLGLDVCMKVGNEYEYEGLQNQIILKHWLWKFLPEILRQDSVTQGAWDSVTVALTKLVRSLLSL